MMNRFIAIGHVTTDLIDGEERLGGSSLFTALCAKLLGYQATIVTSCTKETENTISSRGVDVLNKVSSHDTVFEHIYDSARRERQSKCHSEALAIHRNCLNRLNIQPHDCVVICPNMHEVDSELVNSLAAIPLMTMPQGWFRRVNQEKQVIHSSSWVSNLKKRSELLIASRQDLEGDSQGEMWCRTHSDHFVITSGIKPMNVFEDHQNYEISVPYLVDEKDATGAGDIFAATTWIAVRENIPLSNAIKIGSIAASYKIEKRGIGFNFSRQAIVDRLNLITTNASLKESMNRFLRVL
ncbi:MAG: hypothetical protein KDD48_00610 [Bdellovibrionales bacterium]|nr:hypothetical protein [Bdellovibrionales bacterium]